MESLTPTAAEESAADFSLPGLWCGERSSCWAGVNVSLQQKTARTCSVIAAVCCCRLRGKSWWCYWPESDHMRGTNKHSRTGHRGRSFLTESKHLRVHHRQEVCTLQSKGHKYREAPDSQQSSCYCSFQELGLHVRVISCMCANVPRMQGTWGFPGR